MDPAIAGAGYAPGRNPLYLKLKTGLADYRANWGRLPQARVAQGPTLGPGAEGERVRALRRRLGLAAGPGAYDAALAAQVRRFQGAHGLAVTGRADGATVAALNRGPAPYERAIVGSLARARDLPPSLGERYVLVDPAAGRLWLYEDGRVRTSMKVVTGKPAMPTPLMAGMIRTLVFNPYWNVPEDLVRTSIAPKVLAGGQAYVQAARLQVLSDYDDDAVELDPAKVDWRAVADGRLDVRVRQRPGPKNMMGRVKLMLPNPLGIYLHDTPMKAYFAQGRRLESSGCVRLEDAMALARLLVGAAAADAAADGSDVERELALAEPVPVYIAYFTAMPTDQGLEFRPDVYGRDAALAPTQVAAR